MAHLAPLSRRLLAVVWTLLLTTWWPSAAHSAPDPGPARADVILVLDRSGSMVQNDPQGLTDSAAQAFVDMLDPQDRVALIAFDTNARLLLPLSTVGDGKAAQKALTGMGRPAGQWTDIKAALEAAMAEAGQPTAERATAVLLLTDGKPETQAGSLTPGYREELAQLVSRLAGRAVPIYTVGFGTAEHEILQQIAAGTRAEAFAATSATQAVSVIADVLSRIKERRVTLSFSEDLAPGVAGPVHEFAVPPYTRLLTLSGVANGGVTLKGTAPGGGALEAAPGARLSQGANYAVLTIPNPAPGTWSVQLEGSGRAVVQAQTESSLRLALQQPQPYSQVQRSTATEIEATISGDPDPDSPLELWTQSGAGQAVKLTRGADGVYRGALPVDDGRLALWAMRAGGEVARREFRVYPVGQAAAATPPPETPPTRWPLITGGVIATAVLLLGVGAFNWRRIKRREEQLSGRLGTHSLNGRGKTQLIGDLAKLEARLLPRGWAPLAGLGLVRRELHIYIHQQSHGVRIQINNRPPGDGRLYHEDEVTLGGEILTFHNPRLPRRPVQRSRASVRPAGRPTFRG